MIPRREVTDALLTLLRGAGEAFEPPVPVGDGKAPEGAAGLQRYAILEAIPGGNTDGGMGDPDAEAWLRYRIRAVGQDPTAPRSADVARPLAEWTADVMRAAILNRAVKIEGDTWRAGARRHEAFGGVDEEGPTGNAVDDYLLWVVPRTAPPEEP